MSWELGDVHLQVRKPGSDSSGWKAASTSVSLAEGGLLDIRFGFSVENGSGPIATGDMQLQHKVSDLGGWQEGWASARQMVPGYPDGLVVHPPTWSQHTLVFGSKYAGKIITLRANLDWTTPGVSPEVPVTVRQVEVGELDDFFVDGDLAMLAVNEKAVRGIFVDPFRKSLDVEGRAPAMLFERALVAEYGQGTELAVAGRNFVIRNTVERTADLVRFELEEVA